MWLAEWDERWSQAFIEPDLKTAHLKIYNTFNPFSGFMNATYILKSAKAVSKQAIKAVLQVRTTACDHLYSTLCIVGFCRILLHKTSTDPKTQYLS